MNKASRYLEKIFSIKNKNGHKIFRLFGIKILSYKKDWKKFFILAHSKRYNITKIPENLTLQMMFNNTCNCRCKFCFAEIAQRKEDVHSFSADQLYKDFLPLLPHTKNIVPTDGEITAAQNSLEWLNFIDKNYPSINIFLETNGIAFDDKWSDFAVKNLAMVNFSLNAIDKEHFKKTVWEKDGVFELVERNFDNYLDKLKKKNLSALNPSVSIVLNETNYDTIEEFIKKHLKKNIRNIIVFFDCHQELNKKTYEQIQKTFITLIEIERLIGNKIQLGFELFVPINNVPNLRKEVYVADIETLKVKHADILDLTKNMENANEFFEKRIQLRRNAGKKDYDLYEAKTGVTFHQHIYKGYSVCDNPWTHLRVDPLGNSAPCSWYIYHPDQNINNYRDKTGQIDWIAYFNNPRRKLEKYSFEQGCYIDCMHNCPAQKKISEQEFKALYVRG